MLSWVLVVETIDIGHEEQVIGMDHGSSNGGQGVIVTKLDLGDSYSVIFIDNRNGTHVEELFKGVAGIFVLSPVLNVNTGQQNLADGLLQVCEKAVPQSN